MPKQKTHNEYVKEVYNLVGDEYTILGQYTNSKGKIKFKHNICGYEYETNASSFLCGRRCPHCYGTHKKTTEQFQRELDNLHPNEYEVIGEYENAHTPISIKHKVCGKTYDVAPHSLLKGTYCRYCNKNTTLTKDEFVSNLYNLVGNEYSLVGDYLNMSTKTIFKHNACGYEWSVSPTRFITGSCRCPKCFVKNQKKTHNQFVEKVDKLVGNDYSVLSEYINMFTKINMRHNVCGHEYKVRPCDFIHRMSRCPKCKTSKGEYEIAKLLDKYNIEYDSQKIYDGLVSDNKRHLSYDFYLPQYNLLIEYQGQQHEFAVDWFGGEEKFIRQQEFDKQKRDYANSHNINLLEIWYYDFDNIENILTKELKLNA